MTALYMYVGNEQVVDKLCEMINDYNCVSRGGNVLYVFGLSEVWTIDVKSCKCYSQLMSRGGDSALYVFGE